MEALRHIFNFLMSPSNTNQVTELSSLPRTTSLDASAGMIVAADGYDSSPFAALPAEIHAKIFQELDLSDLTKARLVCSTWRNVIDATSNFAVIVDDKTFDYKARAFPPWKISKCFIRNLKDQCVDDFQFLQFPLALKKLSVWGCVLPSNFLTILSRASNLEELDLANKVLSSGGGPLWKKDGATEKVTFNNLRKLSVFSTDNMASICENLLGLFDQSMPNLQKFKFNANDRFKAISAVHMTNNEMKVATALVLFIASHQKLKTIQITINPYIYVGEGYVERWISKMNADYNYEERLGQMDALQILRINASPFYLQLLRRILPVQTKLKDIRLQVPFMRIMPLQYTCLENSLRLSIQSLASIHLEWLAKFSTRPVIALNFRLFSQAVNLKRLLLKRWWRDGVEENGIATIINLPCLPPTIQDLCLEGFLCASDELKVLGQSMELFPNLTTARILHAGYRPGFGVNGSVAHAFFSRESLNYLALGPLTNYSLEYEDPEYHDLRERFDSDILFRLGQIINFDFARHRRNMQEQEAEERERQNGNNGSFLSCFS